MAMFDSNIDYTKLIQFNGGSLRIATFVEIRDALMRRQKEIYGNDIDLSSASADGQFINEISLILNNILQIIQFGFDSLDPAVATGKYLDVVCSFNNVQRINKSPSIAELYIYNDSNNPITPKFLTFIDKAGQTWTWLNEQDANETYLTTFKPNTYTLIKNVVCDFAGPVLAQGGSFITKTGELTDDVAKNDWNRESTGWINKFVDITPLKLWQYKDAEVGNEEETDEALRSRRYQLLGNKSVSVLEGLQGSLLNISGIKDVFILNNYSGSNWGQNEIAEPVFDGTNVLAHSIYIALRYKDNVEIEDSLIGKLIYNKLTPGISTTPYGYDENNNPPFDDEDPAFKSYKILRTGQITYTIFWKKVQPISPEITINLVCNNNYDWPTTIGDHIAETDIEKAIVKNLQYYLSNVKIDTYLQPSGIATIVQQSDRPKLGISTYFVNGCEVNGNADNYPMNLNYLKYDDKNISFNIDQATKSGIITIGNTITLSSASESITVGNSSSITATLSPDTGIMSVKSSDETVATVSTLDNETYTIIGVSAGTCEIIFEYGAYKQICEVTVAE